MGWAMVISQQSSLLNFVAFWSFSWSINAMVLFCLYIWVAFITLSDPTRSSWSTLWSIPYWNLIIRPCESIRARNVFDSSSELDSLELCLFRVKLGQFRVQQRYETSKFETSHIFRSLQFTLTRKTLTGNDPPLEPSACSKTSSLNKLYKQSSKMFE